MIESGDTLSVEKQATSTSEYPAPTHSLCPAAECSENPNILKAFKPDAKKILRSFDHVNRLPTTDFACKSAR